MLKFNDTGALNNVLAYLESDYETWNDNYENQYPNLTADQLDSLDTVTGFDEFKTVRDFENLFGVQFQSQRNLLESKEINWLNNDMDSTLDPDKSDYTGDDYFNAVLNTSNKLLVGNQLWEFRADGFYINGVLYQPGVSQNGYNQTNSSEVKPLACLDCEDCSWYAWRHAFYPYPGTNLRIKMRIAIHGFLWGTMFKSKTISYKMKSNGKYKAVRSKIYASLGGIYHQSDCSGSYNIGAEKLKFRRKRVTAAYRKWGEFFDREKRNELNSAHYINDLPGVIFPLTW